MKEYFKLKTWLIVIVMLIIGISSAALITYFEFKDSEEVAQAESGNNVIGYAWSEGVGWISFNCSNTDSCATVDYGVNIDSETGNISGYAWSPNIGWISFNRKTCNGGVNMGQACTTNGDCPGGNQCRDDAPGTTGAPPAEPFLSDEDIVASYDSTTGNITGWAKILVLEDDGWINFNNPNEGGLPLDFPVDLPVDFEGTSFGVSIASSTSEFSGWAWNGGVDGAGIGWISFNCADTGAGGCSGHEYKVSSSLNVAPQAANPTAPNWTYEQACSLYAKQAFLRWEFSDPDAGSSQAAYQIIIDTDSNPNNPLIDTGKIEESVSQYSATSTLLAYDETYYWWVRVWDNLNIASELTAGPTFTTYKHELPDVAFAWVPESPSKDEGVKFTHSSTSYGETTITDLLWTAPKASINDPATSTPTIIFNSSGNQEVTLKVTDSDGYYCSLAKTLKVNVTLPGWKEVKPQ
ncbi:MAG: PKD domain-containing protein [Patescibacteria group bacterium]